MVDRLVLTDFPVMPDYDRKLTPAEVGIVPATVVQQWMFESGYGMEAEQASMLPVNLIASLYPEAIPTGVLLLGEAHGTPAIEKMQAYLDAFVTAADDEAEKARYLRLAEEADSGAKLHRSNTPYGSIFLNWLSSTKSSQDVALLTKAASSKYLNSSTSWKVMTSSLEIALYDLFTFTMMWHTNRGRVAMKGSHVDVTLHEDMLKELGLPLIRD